MLATLGMDSVICDRYRICGVLGKGGMGTVFKAEDISLGRMVALKLIAVRNALTDDDSASSLEPRFLREASLSAQVNHPNVVTIYDYGRGELGVESFCYIAMEMLLGETLGARLRALRTGLRTSELLNTVTQIVRGLRAAHQRGLVHRDLKPENIMLSPGEEGEEVVRIFDFGLVKDLSSGHQRGLTEAGTVMGTPEYMAPEQIEGRGVDARTDLYSFGVLLYECITGKPPFYGENAYRVAAQHVRELPPSLNNPVSKLKPSVPLQELVKNLLQKNPDARPQTADDVLRWLRELPEAKGTKSREVQETLSLSTQNKYQTGRKLSETSRASVFDATHLELGRQVAIKVYRASRVDEITRFRRELPALALMRHPANTRVLDVGMTSKGLEGQPFIVMERVRGTGLDTLIEKCGKLPWRRCVELMVSVLDGIAEAHAVGILHRQLTPAHIVVQNAETRRENIKIIGYRIGEGEEGGSAPRLPQVPDPKYVAPEVLRGGPLNERADIYAAAAILHECLLGHTPTSELRGPRPTSLTLDGTDPIPAELAEITRRAVSMDPGERFDSAADFATAVARARGPLHSPETSRDETDSSRVSITQRRLRSTGQPVIWCLTGDPALRKAPMTDVLLKLRNTCRVEEIVAEHRGAMADKLANEQEIPPWVVVFGGMHVILEDPLLAVLARTPEVSRLLVSTHANAELLESAINFCGLDHHITLPAQTSDVVAAIQRMAARSGSARRYYDDLRLVAQRLTPLPTAVGFSTRP